LESIHELSAMGLPCNITAPAAFRKLNKRKGCMKGKQGAKSSLASELLLQALA
jgi:hypothetical protein